MVTKSNNENRNDLESQYHLSNADGTFIEPSNYSSRGIELTKKKNVTMLHLQV